MGVSLDSGYSDADRLSDDGSTKVVFTCGDEVFSSTSQKDTAMAQKRVRRYGTSVNAMNDAVVSQCSGGVVTNSMAYSMRRLSEDAEEAVSQLSCRQRREKYHRSIVRSQSTNSYVMTKKLKQIRRLGSIGSRKEMGVGRGGSVSDPEKTMAQRSCSVDTGLCDFIHLKVRMTSRLDSGHKGQNDQWSSDSSSSDT